MRTLTWMPAVFVALLGLALASDADAKVAKIVASKKPSKHVKLSSDWASAPSAKYANMTASACEKELDARGIATTKVADAPGVLAPVRLVRDVGGVRYHTEAKLVASSPYDVFDCRLVLALSDFSKILRAHDVEEVLMFSAWRPPGKSWPKGKLGTRHPGALAMDAMRFGKSSSSGKDKVWLDVERDFHGHIGSTPCGADANPPEPATSEARELRSIVCEAVDQRLFTVVLTPDYNTEHRNHFHLEVTPEVKWSLVR